LAGKNIPKTNKIRSFLKTANINDKVDWLFDTDFVKQIIEKFTQDLGYKIEEVYKDDGLDGVNKFLEGIDWVLTDIEYKKSFSEYSKKLLGNILGKLIENIGENEVNNLDNNNKFYHLLQSINDG
jgi:hypothetical protein